MDRIGFRYLEVDYPWGLHLFGSLPFSDKKLSVTTPILIREPSEVCLPAIDIQITEQIDSLYWRIDLQR